MSEKSTFKGRMSLRNFKSKSETKQIQAALDLDRYPTTNNTGGVEKKKKVKKKGRDKETFYRERGGRNLLRGDWQDYSIFPSVRGRKELKEGEGSSSGSKKIAQGRAHHFLSGKPCVSRKARNEVLGRTWGGVPLVKRWGE